MADMAESSLPDVSNHETAASTLIADSCGCRLLEEKIKLFFLTIFLFIYFYFISSLDDGLARFLFLDSNVIV